jgi:hypothetical protein
MQCCTALENLNISIIPKTLFATPLPLITHIYVPLEDAGAKAAADATREARRIVLTIVVVYVDI